MSNRRITLVSGPPAAGKSTIARWLAERSLAERAVHLHSDDFYTYIRKGFVLPWLPESRSQNIVIAEALAASASSYARGGFEVFVDGIVGPWFLDPWHAAAREHDLDLRYLILLPDEATVLARATARAAGALADPDPIRFMWKHFSELRGWEGHTLDTTGQAPEQTLAEVQQALGAGRFKLPLPSPAS